MSLYHICIKHQTKACMRPLSSSVLVFSLVGKVTETHEAKILALPRRRGGRGVLIMPRFVCGFDKVFRANLKWKLFLKSDAFSPQKLWFLICEHFPQSKSICVLFIDKSYLRTFVVESTSVRGFGLWGQGC